MLSDTLRDLRTAADMLQNDLAKQIGVSRSTISNLENGREPDLDTLKHYCRIFNVSSDYLLGLSYEPRPAATDISSKLSFLQSVSGKDSLQSSDLVDLIQAMTRYIRTGRPAGESADREVITMIRALTDTLNAASDGDVPALLDASASVISQASAISRMPAALIRSTR